MWKYFEIEVPGIAFEQLSVVPTGLVLQSQGSRADTEAQTFVGHQAPESEYSHWLTRCRHKALPSLRLPERSRALVTPPSIATKAI
jgi:hypothetical protein